MHKFDPKINKFSKTYIQLVKNIREMLRSQNIQ